MPRNQSTAFSVCVDGHILVTQLEPMHVRTGEAVSRAVQGKCTTRVETTAVHVVRG